MKEIKPITNAHKAYIDDNDLFLEEYVELNELMEDYVGVMIRNIS